MTQLKPTPDDLLAGANAAFDFVVPPHILRPGANGKAETAAQNQDMVIQLRPLTIGAFHLIVKAAKNEVGLIPLLMIKESLVEPALSLEQVKQLHLGLIDFLIGHVRQISGLTEKKSQLET